MNNIIKKFKQKRKTANSRKWKHKEGGSIRKMQTAAGGPIKKPIKRYKDGYRYIPDENGGWIRISDNNISDVFATYVVEGKDKRADVRIDKKSENFDRKFKYDETEIPFIKDKEITLTNAGLYTGAKLSTNLLDSIAKYAKISGLPLKTAVGLVAKETSLGNPTVDSSLKKLTGNNFTYQLAKALNGGQHINKGKALNPKNLINFHYEEQNPYLGLKNIAYKKSVGNIDDYGRQGPFGDEDFLKRYREQLKLGENYSDNQAKKLLSNFNPNKSVLQAGFEFYKQNPRKYNYNQTNYPQLVEERGNMVYNSPEFKSWLLTSEYKKGGVLKAQEGSKVDPQLINGLANGIMNFATTFANNKVLDEQAKAMKAQNEQEWSQTVKEIIKQNQLKRVQNFQQWMSDYQQGLTLDNPSQIVANHFGYNQLQSDISEGKNALKNKNAQIDAQTSSQKGSAWVDAFGGLMQTGLGMLGNYLNNDNKSSNNKTSVTQQQNNTLSWWNNPTIIGNNNQFKNNSILYNPDKFWNIRK